MKPRDSSAPASYFPVDERPFKMTAGLHRLGHDFGNGAKDELYFQRDRLAELCREEKTRILSAHPERLTALQTPEAIEVQEHMLGWMKEKLQTEHGLVFDAESASSLRERWLDLSVAIQEDFAVLHRSEDGANRLVLLSVCFPSGWIPETLLGAGFQQTHDKVPEFEKLDAQREQLVQAMIHRGPYVRFVWSLTADPRLDHHPIHAPREGWNPESSAFLRVERQVTVPFSSHSASLFLIRTYVYPVGSLSLERRRALHLATGALPDSVRTYKGITSETLRVLERAAGS